MSEAEPKTLEEMIEMKLHDSFTIGCVNITRVPGGWTYESFYYTSPTTATSCCFVPEPKNDEANNG